MTANLRESKVLGKQYAYILDRISDIHINVDESKVTDKERIDYIFASLENNFLQGEDYPYEPYRLAAFLKTDPICINLPITVAGIKDVGRMWGYCNTAEQERKFLWHFHYLMASLLIRLRNAFYPDDRVKTIRKLIWEYSTWEREYVTLNPISIKNGDKYECLGYYHIYVTPEGYKLKGKNLEKMCKSLDEAKTFTQELFEFKVRNLPPITFKWVAEDSFDYYSGYDGLLDIEPSLTIRDNEYLWNRACYLKKVAEGYQLLSKGRRVTDFAATYEEIKAKAEKSHKESVLNYFYE